MYAEGHAGLTLAISSLLMIPFGDRYETTIFIAVVTLLATLPDIDLSWQKKGYAIIDDRLYTTWHAPLLLFLR